MGSSDDLVNALADLKEEEALRIVEERLNSGEDPFKILEDVRRGMEVVGNRFANNECWRNIEIHNGEDKA
jgi:methanogenic corrinoid protein MtbC1